jgi:hypothetical protein
LVDSQNSAKLSDGQSPVFPHVSMDGPRENSLRKHLFLAVLQKQRKLPTKDKEKQKKKAKNIHT